MRPLSGKSADGKTADRRSAGLRPAASAEAAMRVRRLGRSRSVHTAAGRRPAVRWHLAPSPLNGEKAGMRGVILLWHWKEPESAPRLRPLSAKSADGKRADRRSAGLRPAA